MDYMKGDYNSLTWECAKRPIDYLLAWELVKGWIGTVQMVKNKKVEWTKQMIWCMFNLC
jgi:hypothetical protein